jgi:hypothetical protein
METTHGHQRQLKENATQSEADTKVRDCKTLVGYDFDEYCEERNAKQN